MQTRYQPALRLLMSRPPAGRDYRPALPPRTESRLRYWHSQGMPAPALTAALYVAGGMNWSLPIVTQTAVESVLREQK